MDEYHKIQTLFKRDMERKLLNEALGVVKNVEAEGGDEAELLQHLITQGDAAVMAVLQEHAAGGVRHG